MNNPFYNVQYLKEFPKFLDCQNSDFWSHDQAGRVNNYRPESSPHHPATAFKLFYNSTGICGYFFVQDRFVKSIHSGYQSPVYKDSCVEFFVKPLIHKGYFNFEFNCGGALLVSYIEDPRRTSTGFKKYQLLQESQCALITVDHSLPEITDPEIALPVTWYLRFIIPFSLLETYVGPLRKNDTLLNTSWRGNFYKCADNSTHPHWGAWAAVPEKNFHLPDYFGSLIFQNKD